MAQPYVGEIRMFAGTFAPRGWLVCDGSLVSVTEYESAFRLLGTTYGGDGVNNFALPDLRGRVPLHQGNGYQLAQSGGVEEVTVTLPQLASHTHALVASSSAATSSTAGDSVLATTLVDAYTFASPFVPLAAPSVGAAGGSQPHENRQPFLTIVYIMSMFGIFPSPT